MWKAIYSNYHWNVPEYFKYETQELKDMCLLVCFKINNIKVLGHSVLSLYTLYWLNCLRSHSAFPVAQSERTCLQSRRHWEDPQEEEMATHSSIPAWKIPRTEEPGRSVGVTSGWTQLSDWDKPNSDRFTDRKSWMKGISAASENIHKYLGSERQNLVNDSPQGPKSTRGSTKEFFFLPLAGVKMQPDYSGS